MLSKIRLWAEFLCWYLFWAMVVGCTAAVSVGPYPYKTPPHYCHADPDCESGEECAFPAVDTRPQCLPSKNDSGW